MNNLKFRIYNEKRNFTLFEAFIRDRNDYVIKDMFGDEYKNLFLELINGKYHREYVKSKGEDRDMKILEISNENPLENLIEFDKIAKSFYHFSTYCKEQFKTIEFEVKFKVECLLLDLESNYKVNSIFNTIAKELNKNSSSFVRINKNSLIFSIYSEEKVDINGLEFILQNISKDNCNIYITNVKFQNILEQLSKLSKLSIVDKLCIKINDKNYSIDEYQLMDLDDFISKYYLIFKIEGETVNPENIPLGMRLSIHNAIDSFINSYIDSSKEIKAINNEVYNEHSIVEASSYLLKVKLNNVIFIDKIKNYIDNFIKDLNTKDDSYLIVEHKDLIKTIGQFYGEDGITNIKLGFEPNLIEIKKELFEKCYKIINKKNSLISNSSKDRIQAKPLIINLNSNKTIYLGRAKDNDIVYQDLAVSRYHCKIVIDNGKAKIIDKDSMNGTIINNFREKEYYLKDNDEVMIGKTKFKVKLITT